MRPRLIVTADDLGMTHGVTRGIVESIHEGIVSSTSLMANMPGAREAARIAVQDRFDVGIHLNLTTGRPVLASAEIPSLVRPDGSFYPYREFMQRLFRLKISMREARREFAAQIEAALGMGIRPTHLDTHHHLHLWLPITSAMVRVGRQYRIDRTRTTRTADMAVRIADSPRTMREWVKRRYKAMTARVLGTWFRMPTWRMDPSAFRAPHGQKNGSKLDEWLVFLEELQKLPGRNVVEAPCHPAYIDDELSRCATYVHGREEEVAALKSEELRAAVGRAGIEVVDFRGF